MAAEAILLLLVLSLSSFESLCLDFQQILLQSAFC